jgi:hypothetical protein
MVIPCVSPELYDIFMNMIRRIEDTIIYYQQVRDLLQPSKYMGDTEIIMQAHEYIVDPNCRGCKACGRVNQSNMFTLVKDC